jgi:hypothetical protein
MSAFTSGVGTKRTWCDVRPEVRNADQTGRPPTRLVYEFTPRPTAQPHRSVHDRFRGIQASCWRLAPQPTPSRRACDKLTRRAKFPFRRRANHLYDSGHPVPEEGALAIVTERWDGMWWTQRYRARDGIAGREKLRERSLDVLMSDADAYGEVVWFRRLSGWRQVFRRRESPTGPKRRFPGGDGGKKARYSGESTL